jgi:hypothetical protein
MLLRVDDPDASLFNVPDAAAVDGRRATITDDRGMAFGRATLRGVSPTAVRLEERDDFAPADRYTIRDTAAVVGIAVRVRGVETRPEQAAFRDRVGAAWGWRCAITGETVPEVLDAAHLPGAAWRAGANAAVDGILLRADLHRLLDAGLLTIEDGVVRVSAGSYRQFDGVRVKRPD